MYNIEFNLEEAEKAMKETTWLDDKIVGWGESSEYVYWTNGGEQKFYEKWVWQKLFPEKFEGLKKEGVLN